MAYDTKERVEIRGTRFRVSDIPNSDGFFDCEYQIIRWVLYFI
jgi:hypothetical protein